MDNGKTSSNRSPKTRAAAESLVFKPVFPRIKGEAPRPEIQFVSDSKTGALVGLDLGIANVVQPASF